MSRKPCGRSPEGWAEGTTTRSFFKSQASGVAMSIQTIHGSENVTPSDVEILRPSWGWLLAFGIALLLLGVIALSSLPFISAAYVLYLGFLLIVSGVVCGIQAFRTR